MIVTSHLCASPNIRECFSARRVPRRSGDPTRAARDCVMRTRGRWQRKSSRWRAYDSETRWLSGEERLRKGDVSQLQRSAIFVWPAIFPPSESCRLMEFLSDFGPAFSGANFLSGGALDRSRSSRSGVGRHSSVICWPLLSELTTFSTIGRATASRCSRQRLSVSLPPPKSAICMPAAGASAISFDAGRLVGVQLHQKCEDAVW
jgi:hypothetical protein